ncbi:MAG: mechanosensitive ion channel domain-containing protein [Xanthomonadales bacterium]|jgi:small conductance mechanosensitive channel|nr:mechanosensitive ion channel domain-containing protein [Xanthomonadales bacterium]
MACCADPLAAQQKDPALEKEEAALLEKQAQLRSTMELIAQLDELNEQGFSLNPRATAFRRDHLALTAARQFLDLLDSVENLPPDSAVRTEIEKDLETILTASDHNSLDRLKALRQSIKDEEAALADLSGTDKLEQQAYVSTLQELYIATLKAAAQILARREAIGIESTRMRADVTALLTVSAERLAALLELFDAMSSELGREKSADPNNAELAVKISSRQLEKNQRLDQLKTLIDAMQPLNIDSSSYRATLIKHQSAVSKELLDLDVLGGLLADAWVSFKDYLSGRSFDFFLRMIVVLVILYVFHLISKLIRSAVHRSLNRTQRDLSELQKNLLIKASGVVVMTVGVLIAIGQMGISLGPALAGLGVAGFIVGFALQDSLANFAAGGMILIYRPFDVDDFVEVAGVNGFVKRMSLVSTTILTIDNQTLVIPNNKIWGDVIKNVTAQKARRVDLVIGVSYSDDVEKVERVLEEILAADERILSDPPPVIKLHELGDSSVNFIVRPWATREDFWNVYWDTLRAIKIRFDQEGISIPFPQRDVHLYPSDGADPA